MDWISSLQNAIDYIEDNLCGELDYVRIAREAYSSSFHFQRIFNMLCGHTLGEYIRNRRLTLAAKELSGSDSKVIDVALKYGYDTPESFSRAFTRFHGVTPSQAKANRAQLKSFSRLSVKLILEGGTTMTYRIEQRDAIPMLTKKKRFDKGGEINPKEIRQFWESCKTDGTVPVLCRNLRKDVFGDAIVGVSLDNCSSSDFDYAVGVACQEDCREAGLSMEILPASIWAIFECVGPMPDAFQKLWKDIYTEFFPTSQYQPAPVGGIALEVYPGDNVTAEDYTCEIWISVVKK